jgi:hypothetical protein
MIKSHLNYLPKSVNIAILKIKKETQQKNKRIEIAIALFKSYSNRPLAEIKNLPLGEE